MASLTFKTNINCSNCVAKVAPFLDNTPGIVFWQVDTSRPDKILTIEGSISAQKAIDIVAQAGFSAQPVSGFWGDAFLWRLAALNTLNCLVGCTLGDFSMMIYLQINYPELSVWITMAAAMVAGLVTSIALETILLKIRHSMVWRRAFYTAMSMSFVSMLVMEAAENLTDYIMTGGAFLMHHPYYWFSLGVAMVMGFLVPLPYNYFKLKKYNRACH